MPTTPVAYSIPTFLFTFLWHLTIFYIKLSSSFTWPVSSLSFLTLQMYLILGISCSWQTGLLIVSWTYHSHSFHLHDLTQTLPKCLPTCLLPFLKIWFNCYLCQEAFPNHLLTNRFANIHTCVEHPLPCTPPTSIVWATIWLLLNASIHCYTAYIYSLSPGSSIKSTVYFILRN